MKFDLRPPRDNEWAVCRMLLPETFHNAAARNYLIGIRDEAPRIVSAAAYRQTPDAITHLRIHVVPAFRRQGVGSRIVERLAREGVGSMSGVAEMETAAKTFCERNGFDLKESLTTVEAEMAEMKEFTGRLRARLQLPPGARVIPLEQAPVDQVASLHAQHVAQEGELNQWRGLLAQSPEMNISPVAMLDGQVAGILLGKVEGDTAVVETRVVAPGRYGSWVNATLLAEALAIGWAHGARRARFSYTDSNHDTQKLARRLGAKITSVVARFVREPRL
ncbi:MAG TPA: GNAT family N-acetyltransferase [Bryobacteraceae bacterium]|nr:GNAT family N-acetyltransferase [Bryobacteraceae bacterium]